PVGHDTRHIRTVLPLAKESGLTINVGIIACVNQSIVDSDDANTGREQRLIAADVNFVFVAVVDDDIAHGHTGGPNPVDDLPYDLGRRTAGRGARRVDLDTDNIGRLNK